MPRLFDAPPARGHAQAVQVAGTARWLSAPGQVPVAASGIVPEAHEARCRQALANALAPPRAGGMMADALVTVACSLAGRDGIAARRAVRREVLGEGLVARTCALPAIFDAAWLVEIEAVAAA